MGIAAQNRGHQAMAVEYFRLALAALPEDADLHIQLGVALHRSGEVDDALRYLRHACVLAPDSVSAWYNLAEALKLQACTEEAVGALQRVLSLDSAHVPARLASAGVHASVGKIDTAAGELRAVLKGDPSHAKAWFALSDLKTVRLDAHDVRQLEHALRQTDLAAESRVLLGFALAKALEDQGDYDRSFEVLRQANALQRSGIKWNGKAEHERVNAILRAFDNPQPPPLNTSLGREVILIASIPRCGSTLVEQILASHPEIEGANEIKDLPQVIDAETRRLGSAFPLWVSAAKDEDWQRLGNRYLDRTARWRKRRPRFVDKNLLNWMLAGAALTMLPAARVVICRRDPLETCLACYRQWFGTGAEFSYDLDEMADFCIDYMRSTRFWLKRFPERVFDLEYEALLADPETVTRQLLDFCGLSFDPACLDFHRTERTVLSAPSAAQVRSPLLRNTARANRYGERLDQLRSRLRDAGLLAGEQSR